jgi:N6-adenosine-specific RNA methylase IME4
MTTLYKTVSIDPPWPEFGGGKICRGAQAKYKLIKKKGDILKVVLRASRPVLTGPVELGSNVVAYSSELSTEPVFAPDPEGCLLFCWATRNYLGWAFWLIEALGFRYVTDWVWVKGRIEETHPVSTFGLAGERECFVLQRGGLGQWSQSLHEHLLLARIGKVATPAKSKRPRSVIIAPREGHSVKPKVFYTMMEALGQAPRLEMFAREPRAGWTVWGDEV